MFIEEPYDLHINDLIVSTHDQLTNEWLKVVSDISFLFTYNNEF